MRRGEEFPKFDVGIYSKIALNDLVTFAVYVLAQQHTEIQAEDIVAACFLMFPKRFELRGYPQWPDSTVVNKRWIDCRKKGYIHGSTAQGFSLSLTGQTLAQKVEKTLQGKRPIINRSAKEAGSSELRTRAGRFVRAIEQSEAYEIFRVKGKESEISEFDFRSMLLCTMESSPSTLRNNLDEYKRFVDFYGRNDLRALLDFCESKFKNILPKGTTDSTTTAGGMLKKKLE